MDVANLFKDLIAVITPHIPDKIFLIINSDHSRWLARATWLNLSHRKFTLYRKLPLHLILPPTYLCPLLLNSSLRHSLLTMSVVSCSWVFAILQTAGHSLMDVPLFIKQTQHRFGHDFQIDEYSEGLLCMGGLVHYRILSQFGSFPQSLVYYSGIHLVC